jgi:predicted phage terminase large subunit-like protein
MFFLPPRHGKTEFTTVRYPAWVLERHPDKRIIVGAYNQILANKYSRKTRRIAEQRIPMSQDRTAVEDWETITGGGYRAVGVGAGVTGQGGDLIIIDDPVKSREEANSAAYRERVWDWYTEDLYTRLEPNAALILIMTRWHHDDLAGRILKSEDAANWVVISLSAFADQNDLLGRKEGEALCPERFDVEELKKIKLVMGSAFEALYQQRPTAVEGEIFKREWWQYYAAIPNLRRIIQSWDTGFKKNQDNDFSVCTVWGEGDTGYYLLDRWKQRVEFPELKRAAMQLFEKWKPNAVVIEDKASGQSLIQELKRETRMPIVLINPDNDKIARAHSVTPLCEAGRVYLPESGNGNSWVIDYIDELAEFPHAEHDDQVDSTSQGLAYLARGGASTGMLDYYSQLAAGKKEAMKSTQPV